MIQDIERLQLAALLHDIGKFRQRRTARSSGSHQKHGWEFVTEDFRGFFHPCGDDLGDAILNHHEPRQTKEIEKQVTLADWLSAKEREGEHREREQPYHSALISIMSRLQVPDRPQPTELRYDLTPLDSRRETIFPAVAGSADPNKYEELWRKFTQELQRLAGERGYRSADYQTLVALLHKYTARIPSATPWESGPEQTVPDISLYDHLRTTAAIASCVHREVIPDDLDGYIKRFADRPFCALLKGDISGIQKFLYRIKSEGASRELRGRSFYLQLLTEAIALWILRQFDLPITNLLLASGGHFYLLLPYKKVREEIDALRAAIAEKLWRAHREELSVVLACIQVSANNLEDFSGRWELVSKEINRRKQIKGRELLPEKMFDLFFTPCNERETFTSDGKPDTDFYGFQDLGGEPLRDAKHLVTFEIPDQPLPDSSDWRAIIRSFGLDVSLVNKPEAKPSSPPNATRATVYRLNDTDFLTDSICTDFRWGELPVSYDFRHLPQVIPRKTESDAVADFDQLAEASEGVKWLSVLRMDVDNLGALFEKGLGESATISRMSTLSESVRLFFEGYLPQLCRDYNANHTPDILELIYAGGDDLFLVGGWSALPQIARQIRDEFRAFAGGDHVTLSGGIAIEHKKYPLYQLADDAHGALDTAKEKEKNALSFLQKRMTWEEFNQVNEWQKRLFDAVRDEKPLSHSFLTRLSEIYHLYERDTQKQCKWAWRLIYHLGRAKQMYRSHIDLIDDLRRELVVNPSEASELLQFLRVIVRWTTLRTREDKDGTIQQR
ncbi:type III-A CRISPR-associated protein Cas10/Csm1 [Candidatus Poribacteria bacterium]|nr:MAG: type III-A CRISPR-associated protein Cas10/Csm1 [Candidatus Poribacteria bacterium]